MKRLSSVALSVVLIASLVFALNLRAQTATEPATGRTHTLKITVLDAATRQRVAGAEVATWEARDVTKAVTDATGVATLAVPLDIIFAERNQRLDVRSEEHTSELQSQ